jgi:hypothetical protein
MYIFLHLCKRVSFGLALPVLEESFVLRTGLRLRFSVEVSLTSFVRTGLGRPTFFSDGGCSATEEPTFAFVSHCDGQAGNMKALSRGQFDHRIRKEKQFNPHVNPQFNPHVNPYFNPQFNPPFSNAVLRAYVFLCSVCGCFH